MEKFNKPNKKRKKIKNKKKFYCKLCEQIVVNPKQIKIRKNYPFGKKSKPTYTITHKCDEGILIELKRKTKKDGL
jgi:RNase P subunit RPR2